MTKPRMQVTSVSIGAPAPRALAAFYRGLLGWRITGDEPEWAQLKPPASETGPTLNFEFEPDHVPPVWPTVAGQQQIQTHLDIKVDDLEAAVNWGLAAGARLAGTQPQDDVRVMLDPVGHPFCFFLT
jgi:catechol 2,3-dioxygenase-like lactoylglutathione lyase family enzyme